MLHSCECSFPWFQLFQNSQVSVSSCHSSVVKVLRSALRCVGRSCASPPPVLTRFPEMATKNRCPETFCCSVAPARLLDVPSGSSFVMDCPAGGQVPCCSRGVYFTAFSGFVKGFRCFASFRFPLFCPRLSDISLTPGNEAGFYSIPIPLSRAFWKLIEAGFCGTATPFNRHIPGLHRPIFCPLKFSRKGKNSSPRYSA